MFNNNDTICFLGDSITAISLWVNEISEFFADNFPEKKIRVFNCGGSGDSAEIGNERLNYDCLTHSPKYVNVLFGINDIGRNEYADDYTLPDKEEKIEKAFAKYTENYERLIVRIKDFGATPILCTLVPYDEVTVSDSKNYNCDKGAVRCSEFVKKMGEKYDLKVVDLYSAMLPFMGKEGIMRPDRVHPIEKGFHIMAQTWLFNMGLIAKPDYESDYKMSAKMEKLHKLIDTERSIRFVEMHDIHNMLDAPICERFKALDEKYEQFKKANEEWRCYVIEVYKKYAEHKDKLHNDLLEAMFNLGK